MEKYVVDLDKVLDELELDDEGDDDDENESVSNLNWHQRPATTFGNSIHFNFSTQSILNSTFDRIDLQDAEFSIQSKPPKILNVNPLTNHNSNDNSIVPSSNETFDSFAFSNQKKQSNPTNVCLIDTTDVATKQTEAEEKNLVDSFCSNINDTSTSSHLELQDIIFNSREESDPIISINHEQHGNDDLNIEQIVSTESKLKVDNIVLEGTNFENISVINDSKENEQIQKIVKEEVFEVREDNPSIIDKDGDGAEKHVQTEIIKNIMENEQNDISGNHEDETSVNEIISIENQNISTTTSTLVNENDFICDNATKDVTDVKVNSHLEGVQNQIDSKSSLSTNEVDLSCPQNDLSNNSESLTSADIENMTEAELDKILSNLELDIQKHENEEVLMNEKPIESTEMMINDDKDDDILIEDIGVEDEQFLSKESRQTASETVESVECEPTIIETNDLEHSEPELDLSQSELITTQPSQSISQLVDPGRGGLVQNIAYFERQEMPNGLTEEEQTLGKVKPFWIPDEDAQNCLHCDSKFTIIKRRHHCRSCGKVLCAQCCNYKAKLMYLENKEARVCQLCYVILKRIEEIEKINGHPIDISQNEHTSNSNLSPSSTSSDAVSSGMNQSLLTVTYPDPNNPSEYCSTISPFEQVTDVQARQPPTVMVPVGVLKRPGSSGNRRSTSGQSDQSQSGEPVKQVIFSDGVRPGGDLVESPSTSSSSSKQLLEEKPIVRTQFQLKSPPIPEQSQKSYSFLESATKRIKSNRLVITDPSGVNLPPIINYNELRSIDSFLTSKLTYEQFLTCLRRTDLPYMTFGLTKNLFVNVKLIQKLCCNSVECWSFASRGLATVGQDEIFFCLDCHSLKVSSSISSTEAEENSSNTSSSSSSGLELWPFPRDIFRLFTSIYDNASKASLYTELSHIFFPDGLFGNKENSGFIFTRPSLQCFQNVVLPSPPHLIAILIHKWEIPWAKVFPLRLVLRLGYEYKTYPSPVISFANRKPVYYEIGHTIMNVLADFRNFQYTLSVVKDLVIHVQDRKRITLSIPKLSYEKVCKVLSTSNEHVLAFGGNFSTKADSHFVCTQNEHDDDVQGQYRTQLAHFEGSPSKTTGASFVVFSGALKSSTGLKAKMNIVEDGVLVQIPPTTMEELRVSIRDMKEFKIDCCKTTETGPIEEWIQINWVNDELSTNLGVRSQIDGLNLEGVQSARIFSSPDYTNERYLIRWIEVFLLQINENSRRSELLNTSRLSESVSQAFCIALIDHLDQLYESGLTKIGLRISLDVDKVGYEAGSGGEQLPAQFTGQLDASLIPAIMENISTTGIEDPLVIELLFYILLK